MIRQVLYIILFLCSCVNFAQENSASLAEGNKNFKNKEYENAEAEYRIAAAKNSKKGVASYNLGTSIYKQNQTLESRKYFNNALLNAKTKDEKFRAHHNLGNINFKAKDYGAAIDNYKNALRNNPNDNQTRYNLALAQKMFKEKPPQTNDGKGENKDKAPQQKENQNKDKDKNEKDRDKQKDKEQDKDNNDKSKQDQNPEQKGKNNNQNPQSTKKSDLDNMLDAVNNEEQKVQEKVNGKKVKIPVKTDKDW